MTLFTDLGLIPPLLKALAAEGYEKPTPIQVQAIPQVLKGTDLCGIAQTGTGKTAAFSLPLLQKLSADFKHWKPKHCRALVLAPTRELALQIAENIKVYGSFLKLSSAVIFGGVPVARHEKLMARGIDILVATPGRLLDLIDRRALSLSDVEYLVLDEADQMLDLGFIHALRRIVTLVPKERQTLFFSATMPKTIASLAAQFLKDPVQVSVTPVATTAERVEQQVMFVGQPQKQSLLERVLNTNAIERTLIFTRTKHGADRVVKQLARVNIKANAIHGNKSQPQRERALGAFRTGESPILIATDIAARGIDVDGVSHVINFDLPNVPESYVHRIGRTARAGAEGLAISFCNKEERAYLRDIERLIRQKVTVMPTPEDLAIAEPLEGDDERRGGRNARPPAGKGKPTAWRGGQKRGQQNAASSGRPANGGNQQGKPQAAHDGAPRSNGAKRPSGGKPFRGGGNRPQNAQGGRPQSRAASRG